MIRTMSLSLVACVWLGMAHAARLTQVAQTHTEARPFAPGGSLLVHLRAGDLKISKGTDPQHLVLRFRAESHGDDAAGRVTHRFEVKGSTAEIDLKAPNSVNLDVEIEVPSPADLRVRMLAGDLTVEGLEGNKDLQSHVGDIVVRGDTQRQYRLIDASVRIGDVDGFPGRLHGWLGKSGKVEGSGPYRLHAHVGTGDVRFSFE